MATRTRRRTETTNRPMRLLPVVRDLPIEVVRESARLNGSAANAILRRAITGVERELSMDGANVLTLTLEDEAREILRSPLLDGSVDIDLGLDGRWRWDRSRDVGGLRVGGTQTTLRMWCLPSALLRAQTTPLAKPSKRMDLAGFVAFLARERPVRDQLPGLRWVVPAPGELPPADTTVERGSTTRRTSGTGQGFTRAPRTIQSVYGPITMTAERLKIADQLLAVADRLNATPRAKLALLMAGIVESKFTNLGWSDGSNRSRGVLQARPGISAGPKGTITEAQSNDVEYMAECFLKEPGFASRGGALKLAREHPGWSPGTIAWNVEMPIATSRPRYDQCRKGAEQLLNAWGGSGSGGGHSGGPVSVPGTWRRGNGGTPESSWTCLDRYARQLGRRRFIALPNSTRPRLVMAADQQLIQVQPHLTLNGLDDPLLTEHPSIELEGIRTLQTIELTALAAGWSAPPGGVVDVRESGPVDGPWLVQRIISPGTDPTVRVTLQQPTTKVEATASRSTAGSRSGSSATSKVPEKARKVYDRAVEISKKGYPYVYGGGHGGSGEPTGGGYDCSGYVSACLIAAGLLRSVRASDALMSWGQPGRGKWFTVWTYGTGRAGHAFIEFHGLGAYKRADTSPQRGDGVNPPKGARVRTGTASTARFTARHYPGC